MAAYNEELTNSLRMAQIAALKQRYLDIIDEANRDKASNENAFLESSNQAFLEQQRALRDRPQQLRALGLGGGMDSAEHNSIMADYGEKVFRLKRTLENSLRDLNTLISVQSNRMNQDLEEFNARMALEDFARESAGGGGGGGGGGGRSKSGSKSGAKEPEKEEQVFDYFDRRKVKPAEKTTLQYMGRNTVLEK